MKSALAAFTTQETEEETSARESEERAKIKERGVGLSSAKGS